MHRNAIKPSRLLLLVLACLLAACATPSPPLATACPALPKMPYVTPPVPTGTYLKSAMDDDTKWQGNLKKLIQTKKP